MLKICSLFFIKYLVEWDFLEMGSSQGSSLSTNMAGFVDGSSARRDVSYLDGLPVYVKELIAGGAAGAFAKTAVAPLERIKILFQVSFGERITALH